MNLEFLEYTLLEQLGAGASAQVWRATRSDGSEVAIKLFGREFGEETAGILRGEADRLAALSHRSIVDVYDSGQVEAKLPGISVGSYIVMELVAGPTLDAAQPTNWEWVESVVMQLLDALAAAHSRNIVHLDVKPTNILLRDLKPPDVVLADFGIAHRFRLQAREGEGRRPFAGTPAYMAPEQISASTAEFGPWTDIYAVGCLVMELCSGVPPFVGESLDVLRMHMQSPVPRLRPRFPVPDDLGDWLARCLAKPTADRFQRAADAAWALMQLSRDRLIERDTRSSQTMLIAGAQTMTWVQGDLTQTLMNPPDKVRRVSPEVASAPLRDFPLPPMPMHWSFGQDIRATEFAAFATNRSCIDALWHEVHQAFTSREPRGVVFAGGGNGPRSDLLRLVCSRVLAVGAGAYFLVLPATDARTTVDRLLSQLFRLDLFTDVQDALAYQSGMLDTLGRERPFSAALRREVDVWVRALLQDEPIPLEVEARCRIFADLLARADRLSIVMFEGADADPEMLVLAEVLLEPRERGAGVVALLSVENVEGDALTSLAARNDVCVVRME